jgi:hypothetical protein
MISYQKLDHEISHQKLRSQDFAHFWCGGSDCQDVDHPLVSRNVCIIVLYAKRLRCPQALVGRFARVWIQRLRIASILIQRYYSKRKDQYSRSMVDTDATDKSPSLSVYVCPLIQKVSWKHRRTTFWAGQKERGKNKSTTLRCHVNPFFFFFYFPTKGVTC